MSRRSASLLRSGAALVCALVLLTSAQVLAQDSDSSSPPPAESPSDSSRRIGLGVMLDVGAPDGIGFSAVVRPLPWLRFNTGLTTNTLSIGVRGGVSLVPFSTLFSPSLNADLGHYFDADFNQLIDKLGGIPLQASSPVGEVGYNYAGASLGLEIGRPERFSFSLRAGLSYGTLTLNDAERLLRDVTGDPTLTAQPLTIRFTSPSIKLGFLLYFY
jgi:hypothetical protein